MTAARDPEAVRLRDRILVEIGPEYPDPHKCRFRADLAAVRAILAASPEPAEPRHTEGQGEVCDSSCPHWTWANSRVAAREPEAVRLIDIVKRHTHQGQWAMTRFAGPEPEEDCHLCRALVAAGILTLDEIGSGTRAALASQPAEELK